MKFIVQSLIFACLQALTVPQITKRGTGPGEIQNRCEDSNFCGEGLECDIFLHQCKRSEGQGCKNNGECANALLCFSQGVCSAPFENSGGVAGSAKPDKNCIPKSDIDELNCEKGLLCDNGKCKKVQGQKCESDDKCFTGLSCMSGRCIYKTAADIGKTLVALGKSA